jgi:thiamine biosynthesis protein ThiI
MSMDYTILIRYGEIALKGPLVRDRMERMLVESISWRLQRLGVERFHIYRGGGRIFIKIPHAKDLDSLRDYAGKLANIFGIVSLSPAIEVGNDIETISSVSVKLARDIASNRKISSFAIRARRVESYPITSKDIEKIVGQKVKEALNIKVDLENPDLEIFIEVREEKAYIFTDVIEGPGGLPYGVEGLCISLFSGGMDSTLATWLIAKRGCEVLPLHMVNKPFYSDEAYQRVFDVLKKLREWIPRDRLEMVIVDNYGELLKMLSEHIPLRLRCLACKKLMLLIAQRLARERNAKAIVTGESIGQVASQTLDNIYVISKGIEVPILRPLIAFDKQEIADMLRKIGLLNVTARDVGRCGFLPPYPETHAKPDALDPYIDLLNKLADQSIYRSVYIE